MAALSDASDIDWFSIFSLAQWQIDGTPVHKMWRRCVW